MDPLLFIPYETNVCIPELNQHYKRYINFQVRDTGSNMIGQGYQRVDICVRSEADSYDRITNLKDVTLIM